MRIAISGCQNSGKTTLIKDMLASWSMYSTPKETYRDAIKKSGLPCNQKTTPETQQTIMDFMCDQLMNTTKDDCVVFDRCPIDCLVYSLYAYCKGVEGFDEEFIQKQILLAREAMSFIDVIFNIPIVEGHDIPLVADELRDIDPTYREEINNLFSEIFSTYITQTGPYFKFDDCPAVIEVFGNPKERIEMIKLYINENGLPYGEEESLMEEGILTLDGQLHNDNTN